MAMAGVKVLLAARPPVSAPVSGVSKLADAGVRAAVPPPAFAAVDPAVAVFPAAFAVALPMLGADADCALVWVVDGGFDVVV